MSFLGVLIEYGFGFLITPKGLFSSSRVIGVVSPCTTSLYACSVPNDVFSDLWDTYSDTDSAIGRPLGYSISLYSEGLN